MSRGPRLTGMPGRQGIVERWMGSVRQLCRREDQPLLLQQGPGRRILGGRGLFRMRPVRIACRAARYGGGAVPYSQLPSAGVAPPPPAQAGDAQGQDRAPPSEAGRPCCRAKGQAGSSFCINNRARMRSLLSVKSNFGIYLERTSYLLDNLFTSVPIFLYVIC